MASEAVFDSDGLRVRLDVVASLATVSKRTIEVRREAIVQVRLTTTNDVAREIRWKIAGTALTRRRALGWFSWIGHRRRFAWVWLTPGREVVRFETSTPRPGLVAVPLDWFDAPSRDAISRA